MKKLITILLLTYVLQIVYSQRSDKIYYFYTDDQIKENAELNRHVWQFLFIDDSDFVIGTSGPNAYEEGGGACGISAGTVKLIDDILYLYDKELNRTYRFRQIDFYTLEALNHTAVFVQGIKLYLHYYVAPLGREYYTVFFQRDDLLNSTYWKTGIKNGIHSYLDYNTRSETYYYYQNNIMTDSITIPYFYNRDYESMEKKINFVERYGYAHNITNYYLDDLELKLCGRDYLLTKEKKVISAGSKGDLRYWSLRNDILEDFQDINRKYNFVLSDNDSLLIVRSYTSSLPEEVPLLNVGDTLTKRLRH